MLRTLFCFGGAINRRAFMLGNLALFGLIVGLTTLITVGAQIGGPAVPPRKALLVFVMILVAVCLAASWPSLALYLKRFRDLGVGVLPGLAIVLIPPVTGNLVALLHISPFAKLGVQGLTSLISLGTFIACCALKGRVPPPASPQQVSDPRTDPVTPRSVSPGTAPRAQFGLRGL